jgi:cell division protein FtsQ
MRPDLKPIPRRMLPKKKKAANKQRYSRVLLRQLFWPIMSPISVVGLCFILWYINAPHWISEKIHNCNESFFKKSGFVVTTVDIKPLKYTNIDVILKAAQLTPEQALLQLDPDLIRGRIEQLPWVWSAIVKKKFPDQLMIHVIEREPIAIWHEGKAMRLVDKEGVILSDKVSEKFKELPSIAGQAAAKNAPPLFQKLEQYPTVHSLVKTAVCIGKRRWNLLLTNGTQVYLPESDLDTAFMKLNDLAEKKLLDTLVIKIVDLRLEGRIILKMIPEAGLKLQTKGTAKET